MAPTDTSERILHAAERVFAAHGLAGFSLRAVTAEAGVNVAAVNYHFGSKGALLRALVRKVFASVHAEQLRLLEEMETGEQPPTVDAIVAAYATPIFALFDTGRAGEWGRAWMSARESLELEANAGGADRLEPPRNEVPPMMFHDSPVTRRYAAALARAIPDAPENELWWRFERATNLLMANQGRRAMPATLASLPADAPSVANERRWLLTFLVGALRGPATDAG